MEEQKQKLFDTLSKDIKDKRVLDIMMEIPRERFVPDNFKEYAYLNAPLDIGYGQTISQPYIVALMCELLDLKDTDRVLDIGTGSGYLAAILSRLCKEVVSMEIVPELVERSTLLFKDLGYTNIKVVEGNGKEGCSEYAPFNKIVCSASTAGVPKIWRDELRDDGIVVFPLKVTREDDVLVRGSKTGEGFLLEYITAVRFVPLVD